MNSIRDLFSPSPHEDVSIHMSVVIAYALMLIISEDCETKIEFQVILT